MVARRSSSPPVTTVEPKSRKAWRLWLFRHHGSSSGVWLVLAKRHVAGRHLLKDEAIEEALCVGWIDSKPRALDANRSMLYFAPRKPRSGWSRTNKRRIKLLMASGQMMTNGLAAIALAKKNGSWTSLDPVERLQIPSDLQAAFEGHAGSAGHFQAFPRFTKRAILEWINTAKCPETRASRIHQTAHLAARNERANQWKRKAT